MEREVRPADARREAGAAGGAPTRDRYRIESGGASLAYLPDHEPGLGTDLESAPAEWISGMSLAEGVDALVHDGQYRDDEYAEHVGWGHCGMREALGFAARAGAARTLLFHHDPGHDDDALETMAAEARERADGSDVDLAREGEEIALG